ncbi:MAG TPA: Hsp20/alpha crystallin family protein [Mycobacterium sp.]|nr:Hsp20/alpha crystallin family protein [Mycobacterium sp.]
MSNLTLWSRPAWDVDRFVTDFFGDGWLKQLPATAEAFRPAAEIVRDGDDAVVRLELPGVDIDNDVTVEVDHGQLVIRGERRDEHAENTDGRSLREVRYGSFRRAFRLPEQVTGDAIAASYDAGVLSIRVTGAYADAAAQRIAISK